MVANMTANQMNFMIPFKKTPERHNNLIDSKMVYLITPFGVFIFLSKVHPALVKSTNYIITLISFSFYYS